MLIQLIRKYLVVGLALATTTAYAQVVEGDSNVIVEGVFISGEGYDFETEQSSIFPGVPSAEFPLSFTLTIQQDVTSASSEQSGELSFWADLSQEFTIEVFSSSNELLFSETRTSAEQTSQFIVGTSAEFDFSQSFNFDYLPREYFYSFIEVQDDLGIRRIEIDLGVPSFFYLLDGAPFPLVIDAILAQNPPQPLFASLVGFPTFKLGDQSQVISFYIDRSIDPFTENPAAAEQNHFYSDLTGYITSISRIIADADSDGVPDELDDCSASLTNETVWFDGWHDSGVTNYVDADGCTVMDRYAACNAEQEEQEVNRFSFGSSFFYSGPSYCEKQVAYDLVSDGLIDFNEARALRDALYHAARNQPEI
jgi:hypothetical protein